MTPDLAEGPPQLPLDPATVELEDARLEMAALRRKNEEHARVRDSAERVAQHLRAVSLEQEQVIADLRRRIDAFPGREAELTATREQVRDLEHALGQQAERLAAVEAERDTALWSLSQGGSRDVGEDGSGAANLEAPSSNPLFEARAEVERLTAELEQVTEQLVQKTAHAEADREEAMGMFEASSAALEAAAEECDLARDEADRATRAYEEVRSAYTAEVADLEARLTELRTELETASAGREEMSAEIERLTGERDGALTDHLEDVQRLGAELEMVREELIAAQEGRASDLEAAQAGFDAQLDQQSAELDEARVTIRYLERLGRDVEALQTGLAEAESHAERAEAELAALRAEHHRLEAAAADAEDRAARAQAELAEVEADHARLESALAEADKRALSLATANAELERRLAAAPPSTPTETAPREGVVSRPVPPPRSAQRIKTLSVRSIKQLASFVSHAEQATDTLAHYVNTFPSEVRSMRVAIDADDRLGVESIARRLHKQFQEIGVQKLADLSAHIELASSGGELAVSLRLLDALESEFRAVRPWLTES